MKFIITRASVLTLFAVVLSFLSTSISAEPWQDGFNTGKATCQVCQASPTPPACPTGQSCQAPQICQAQPQQACPTGQSCQAPQEICSTPKACPTCQICQAQQACPTCQTCPAQKACPTCPSCQADYQMGKQEGKRECQTNPQSCAITPQDPNAITQAGKDAGKNECQTNPDSCGLKTPEQVTTAEEAAKTAGIQSCTDNPESCGLNKPEQVTAATEAGKTAGIQSCTDNPESCGLNKPEEVTAAKEDGKKECKANSQECGIFTNPVPEITKIAIKEYCKTDFDLCGILGNRATDVASAINTICSNPSSDNCGITLVTQEGIEEGKRQCQKDPAAEGCYTKMGTEDNIPNEYCDNKTCFSSLHGQLYLPAIELDNDNQKFLKDLKMDALFGSSDLILVHDLEEIVKHFVDKTELKIETAGEGYGGVISSPAGIFCPTDCDENYGKDDNVRLVAAPLDSKSIFAGWSGDAECNGTSIMITVQMNSAKTCTATFDLLAEEKPPTDDSETLDLTLTISGNGKGTVTSQPNGIDCNNDDSPCKEAFPKSTVVALTAKPKSASSFMQWKGDCVKTLSTQERTIATIAVSMDEAENCEAQFGENYQLKITINGDGKGTVISKVAGINCPGDCITNYPHDRNYVVVLQAKPDYDSSFVEWRGDHCTDEVIYVNLPIIAVLMDKDKTCNAMFELKTD